MEKSLVNSYQHKPNKKETDITEDSGLAAHYRQCAPSPLDTRQSDRGESCEGNKLNKRSSCLSFFKEKNKNKIQTTTESLILAQDER